MQSSHSGPNLALRPITREEWLDMLARNVTDEPEPAIRRTQRRHNMDGTVTLALINADGRGLQTALRTVSLLQVSDDGIMIRSHADIPLETVVGMQVYLEEDTFALLGRVIHCTDTIGGYKVGIQLAFIEPPAEAR